MGGRKNQRRFPQISSQFKAMVKALVEAGLGGNASAEREARLHHCRPGWGGPPAQARARSSRSSRSRALRVNDAARSNSACASAKRPSLKRKSPRTLGKRG